jgi:hypothetical protein
VGLSGGVLGDGVLGVGVGVGVEVVVGAVEGRTVGRPDGVAGTCVGAFG